MLCLYDHQNAWDCLFHDAYTGTECYCFFKFNIHIFRQASCVVAVSHYFLTMCDSYRTSFVCFVSSFFWGEGLINDSVLIFLCVHVCCICMFVHVCICLVACIETLTLWDLELAILTRLAGQQTPLGQSLFPILYSLGITDAYYHSWVLGFELHLTFFFF